jgi:hypothetical protein
MERIPDFQQHAFAIIIPLVIPKPQHRNALAYQVILTNQIMFHSFGKTVLRAIEFQIQLSCRTIEVKNVIPHRMLPAELEPRETPSPQRLPKSLFFFGLRAAKTTSIVDLAH